MINYKLFIGIVGISIIVYAFLRILSSKEKSIEKEFEEVLSSEEYKVKGQYD